MQFVGACKLTAPMIDTFAIWNLKGMFCLKAFEQTAFKQNLHKKLFSQVSYLSACWKWRCQIVRHDFCLCCFSVEWSLFIRVDLFRQSADDTVCLETFRLAGLACCWHVPCSYCLCIKSLLPCASVVTSLTACKIILSRLYYGVYKHIKQVC